jgi:16S rRNA (uracil1498-N3)-methyltransferase
MMSDQHSVFYISPECVQGAEIAVHGPEVHHIRNVMRKKLHDALVFTDGKGNVYTTQIVGYTRSSVEARIVRTEFHEQQREPDIACAFVPLKGLRSDFIVEKCTEIGVSHFYPFVSRRAAVRRLSHSRIEHFQRLARSAMLQSRRYYLPEITVCNDTEQLALHFQDYDLVLCGDAHGSREIPGKAQKILYIIGPEGGFDETELTVFKQQGVHFFSLGDHRLRSETAALVAAVRIWGQI